MADRSKPFKGREQNHLRQVWTGASAAIIPGLPLTFVLWSELFHLGRQGLVEALLSYDQGLTHRVVIVAHHTRVTPHLQKQNGPVKISNNTKKDDVLKTFPVPGGWRAPAERLLLVVEV